MLQPEYLELAHYRLEKAIGDLKAAEVNIANNLYAIAINRAYYAMFHATRALLAIKKLDSKRHSAIIGMLNKEYCATGVIENKYNAIIAAAFQIRMRCDYDDFYVMKIDESRVQYANACEFVERVKRFFAENYPGDVTAWNQNY